MGFWTYLIENPTMFLVFIGGAYWMRREMQERNGHGMHGSVKDIANTMRECSDVLHKIHVRLDDAEAVQERILHSQSRVEQKIDAGLVCPMRRSGQ